MSFIKCNKIILVLPLFLILIYGCFKQAVDVREPLPYIVWPEAPESPMILFVNSVSGPKDLSIQKSIVGNFFRYLKGEEDLSLTSPYGLATDADGRLFVVDSFNKKVHVFDAERNDYYTVPEDKALFESPIDIAIDKKNKSIFVTDSRKAVIMVFKNNGKEYVQDIGEGLLQRPTGIAINEITDELLVVDTLNSEILRYDLASYRVKGVIGKSGDREGMLHYPTNIFTSRDGTIFVTDSLNFRIQIFSSGGKFLNSFGKPGDTPGNFSRPKGVAVDSDGNIYVVDALFDNVQIFSSKGDALMDFGGPGHKYGEFWLPTGIFIDDDDRIYVSDSYNKRVQIFQYLKKQEVLF